MTPEEKVYGILLSDAAVTALVPRDRILPPGDWQEIQKPYIVHFPVAGETTQCHDGPQALNLWSFYQVSVFAATYSEARQIATVVRASLDGYCDEDTDRIALAHPPIPQAYDTDLKVAHVVLDFEIAGALD